MCLLQMFNATGNIKARSQFFKFLITSLQFYMKKLEWWNIKASKGIWGMHKFLLYWLGYIVPHFSLVDMLFISSVIKWIQCGGLHYEKKSLILDTVLYMHISKILWFNYIMFHSKMHMNQHMEYHICVYICYVRSFKY